MPLLQITCNKAVEQVELLQDIIGQPMRLRGVSVSWGNPAPLQAPSRAVVNASNNHFYTYMPSWPELEGAEGFADPFMTQTNLQPGSYTMEELAEEFNRAATNGVTDANNYGTFVVPGYGAAAESVPVPEELNIRCRWDPDVQRFEFWQIPSAALLYPRQVPPLPVWDWPPTDFPDVFERSATLTPTYILLAGYNNEVPTRTHLGFGTAYDLEVDAARSSTIATALFGLTAPSNGDNFLVVPAYIANTTTDVNPPNNLLRAFDQPVAFNPSDVQPGEEEQLGALVDISQIAGSSRSITAYSPNIGSHSMLYLPRPPYLAPNAETSISQNPSMYYMPLNISLNTNDIRKQFVIETKLDSPEGGACPFGENKLHQYTLYLDYGSNDNHF